MSEGVSRGRRLIQEAHLWWHPGQGYITAFALMTRLIRMAKQTVGVQDSVNRVPVNSGSNQKKLNYRPTGRMNDRLTNQPTG